MNIQMMEGLVGASTSIKMSGTPMSVYRQASDEGDEEKMKRSLGYIGDCVEKTVKYQEKLDKGMETEAKTEREKAKLEREAAIEKRRDERKQAEEGMEGDAPRSADLVQISDAAKTALRDKPAETAIDSEPVIYTESGGISPAPAENKPTMSCFA